jgi:hypothetical protein
LRGEESGSLRGWAQLGSCQAQYLVVTPPPKPDHPKGDHEALGHTDQINLHTVLAATELVTRFACTLKAPNRISEKNVANPCEGNII